MRYEVTDLTTLRFEGPRFEDHGLDLDVLPELIAYKTLLVETAKELWRRQHPERERLPRGFEDSIRLKFYGLESGSTAVPLRRVFEFEDGVLPLMQPDEVDQAAGLIDETIIAAAEEQSLPAELPANVIPLFGNLGQSLRPDEALILDSGRSVAKARYTPETRRRLMEWSEGIYEDVIEIEGEVRSADLDSRNFGLRLEDGCKVGGKFESDHEAQITEALQGHSTRRITLTGMGEFTRQSGALRRIGRVDSLRVHPVIEAPFDETARPIWDVVAEIGATVADGEWEEVPRDLSKNLDHYLHGAPRHDE